MAQKIIRLGFPKAAQEYKAGQLDQLVNTLEQMILQLNNTSVIIFLKRMQNNKDGFLNNG